MSHARITLFALSISLALAACGDDGSVDAGADAATDTSVGDAAMDSMPTDTGVDAGMDGGTTDAAADSALVDAIANDAAGDAVTDAADASDAADVGDAADASDAADAAADAAPDAGSCGGGPACGAGERCWGTGCSCVEAIDGDSYLRTDGTAVYYLNLPHVLAETAAGVPLTGIVEIMDGWRHTCGLRNDGTVWCWAKRTDGNAYGELGRGAIGGATTPMRAEQVLTGPGAPLTGIGHLNNQSNSRCYIESTTCAIRAADGALFCWGIDNSGGGAGSFYTDGTVGSRPYATQIMASASAPLLGVSQVAIGLRHACALTATGGVSCWGMNVGGPLGQGDQTLRQYPTPVALPGGVVADAVGVGADFSCALSSDTVFCWGASGTGAVGLGDPTDPANHDGCINYCHLTPAQVIDTVGNPLSGVIGLEVNYQSACAVMADHTLRCWGADVGQVATEPTIGGGMLGDVAQMSTCTSGSVRTGIRYLQRDGTLHYQDRMIPLLCP